MSISELSSANLVSTRNPPAARTKPNLAHKAVSMHNEDLALAFDETADLLSLLSENPFRINAYRRAAQIVRSLPEELAPKVTAGFDPDTLPGIGVDLTRKIRAFFKSGELPGLAALRRSVPSGLRELMHVQNIGPKRARALYVGLDIKNLNDLRAALKSHRVRELPRFGEKLETQLAKSVLIERDQDRRVLRHIAAGYAEALRARLAKFPGVRRVDIAGSLRRGRETIGDIDLVLCADKRIDIAEALRSYEETESLIASGPTRASALLKCGLQVDVRAVPSESHGAALHYFTGSKAHNVHVRKLAQARGLKINEYGVFRNGKRVGGDTESSIFSAVGLPYIEPELREDRGEIEAAQNHRPMTPVERKDLRGDLHVHTKSSDGGATLSTMAKAAEEAGLEYIAITDHSKHIGLVHGLDVTALTKQLDQIDALNESQRGITLLKGIEVDVLEDGSLALPQHILGKLDVVIASLHDHFSLSTRKQTDRLLRLLDNPCVSILGHPTARLIGERQPIRCDWGKIFRRARERPLYLELNAQPTRLDLDDILVREAAANEILISIASDAHTPYGFQHLSGGILQARRGWLTKDNVLNTRALLQVRNLLRKTFLA